MQCKIPSSSAFVIFLQLSAMLSICIGVTRAVNLRCQCIDTITVSKPTDKMEVMNVEINNSGPHCPKVEVIITLSNGLKSCLNPEVKWLKDIVNTVFGKKGNKAPAKLQRKT